VYRNALLVLGVSLRGEHSQASSPVRHVFLWLRRLVQLRVSSRVDDPDNDHDDQHGDIARNDGGQSGRVSRGILCTEGLRADQVSDAVCSVSFATT